MDKINLYFNEELHKYTDDLGRVYTSSTTLKGKYINKFDTKKMARICAISGMKGNPKYAGKSAKQLEAQWLKESEEACDKGNKKHNFLETVVKNSNGYKKISGTTFINDRLYTLDDILLNNEVGRIDLSIFEQQGLNEKYPKIYNLLLRCINDGYKLYAEIGVYNSDYLISGLIDLLLIKNTDFLIIDWKTNKAPIRYDSGYFEKDNFGNLTENFIKQNQFFKPPVSHLADSIGNQYTIQLSIYDYLVEGFGFNCKGNILCHIRDIGNEQEIVEMLPIKYLKKEVYDLFVDNYKKKDKQHILTLT